MPAIRAADLERMIPHAIPMPPPPASEPDRAGWARGTLGDALAEARQLRQERDALLARVKILTDRAQAAERDCCQLSDDYQALAHLMASICPRLAGEIVTRIDRTRRIGLAADEARTVLYPPAPPMAPAGE